MTIRRAVMGCLAVTMIGAWEISPAIARDAAFLDPGGGASSAASTEAIKVEPKNEVDIGETSVGVARRTTLFFVNATTLPVQVEKVSVNNDANVTAEISNDDCTKQGTISPQSRCSVEVSVTPTGSGGAWSAELLLTHNAAGRIARAKISGRGTGGNDKKETGLSVSSKEAAPVNFGEVTMGNKAVRSALMVNDSPEPISIYSIDVIEADNGLHVLDGGCEVNMELKSGESCPVTIVWAPTKPGQVSTDLIIRHSGRLGFAVVPVRGTMKGGDQSKLASTEMEKSAGGSGKIPMPPTADELERAAAGKIPLVPAAALGQKEKGDPSQEPTGTMRLIGTVGSRAVLLVPDGTTKVVSSGDEFDVSDSKTAKVVTVSAKSIDLLVDGKLKTLKIGAAPELLAKATAASQVKSDKEANGSGGKSGSSKSGKSNSANPSGATGALGGGPSLPVTAHPSAVGIP